MTSAHKAGVEALRPVMEKWRHDLHRIPELGYEEKLTSDYVAQVLADCGYLVMRGIGGTGLVATRTGRGLAPPIALRADMDALPIEEAEDNPHRSLHAGRMHACGHDGHMTMLLGAAAYLVGQEPAGDVHFIFQPAEETGAGAQAMIRDGILNRIEVAEVYGLHNWPGLAEGSFHVCDGPQMAAYDFFDIEVQGAGCHAALPQNGRDSLLAASQIVQALQAIVSRGVDPLDGAVVSVTQIHGGEAYNVIPATTRVSGCTRSLSAAAQRLIEAQMAEITHGIAIASGCSVALSYRRGYPLTLNVPAFAARAKDAAVRALGPEAIEHYPRPTMASEDFSFFLRERPGCYAFLGAGHPTDGSRLHSPSYQFNDRLLTMGALWWVEMAMR